MLVNLTIGELITEFIIGFIDSLVIFLSGIFFTRWYARKKRWDDSTKTAFSVNLLWFILNVPLEFFFLYFLGTNLIFQFLRIVLEMFIISFVFAIYYQKEYSQSLLFLVIVRILLYIVGLIFDQFFGVLTTILTTDDESLVSSGQMYYFCILLIPKLNHC